MDKLKEILKQKNVKLSPIGNQNDKIALQRKDITRFLATNFKYYNRLREYLTNGQFEDFNIQNTHEDQVIRTLKDFNYITEPEPGKYRIVNENGVRVYLTGGWLEELLWHAIQEAGADAATFGQRLHWKVGDYDGQNEIDVIARYNDHLVFISCKTNAPLPRIDKRLTYRNKYKDNLAEADDYQDHFGQKNDKVILVSTHDLYDEDRDNIARYGDIMGKAQALKVHLLGLEDLPYDYLVNRLKIILSH